MIDSSQRPWRGILIGVFAMAVVVTVSNVVVQYAINDWLTWAAFTDPVAFLVTDLSNRSLGPAAARMVVYIGFLTGVVLSLIFSDPRIAIASGTAFLVAQLLDVQIFDRLRRASWWKAPLVSSGIASTVDTALFFSLAFAGTEVPWVTLALGDLVVKFFMASCLLLPYRLLMRSLPRSQVA